MKSDIHLDLKGLKCPLPVLKIRKALRELENGQQITVETTDPLAVIDVPAFCSEQGHILLEAIDRDDGHQFLIEKG